MTRFKNLLIAASVLLVVLISLSFTNLAQTNVSGPQALNITNKPLKVEGNVNVPNTTPIPVRVEEALNALAPDVVFRRGRRRQFIFPPPQGIYTCDIDVVVGSWVRCRILTSVDGRVENQYPPNVWVNTSLIQAVRE